MKPRTGLLLKIGMWVAGFFLVAVVVAGIAAKLTYDKYVERADKYDLSKIDDVAERSAVYDGDGVFYSFCGGENRLIVPLDKVSKHFQDALLAREDSRFWEHEGVDARGIVRAAWTNFRAGETKQGASTITQQLARNACGFSERSLDRKALEAVMARRIEQQYSKAQILELYVNRIYFGSGFYGIETAARGYFDKPAAELTLGESATLAGLIRNPNRLAPTRDLPAALEQRNVVLARMAELQMISAEDRAAAQAQELKLSKRKEMRITDDAVMDAVLRELETLLAPETTDYGGLKIHMTIDPQLQGLAQAAADSRLSEIEAQKQYPHPKKKDFVPGTVGDQEKPTDYLQTAVVIVENKTGALKAVVGARDYAQSKYSRALLSKRQIGSTFKPFVYAAAFERGLLPGTAIDDSRIAAGEFRDIPKNWSPENSDGEYGGLQPASLGLVKSRNTMSVRVGEMAGMAKVREVARGAGLGDSIPEYPVTFLGAFETTARDLTAAYAIFPNGGIYRAPYLISKVEDRDGQVLYEAPHTEKKVISEETAWMTTAILQQVLKTGTASKASAMGWHKQGAGKTGTTNDFFDAWFVGYTSSLTCGVWVGMDQPATIMEKGYGSALALPIWVDIMQKVPEKTYPSAPFTPGMPLGKAAVCSVSGGKATAACVAQGCAYEISLPISRIPVDLCRTHSEALPVAATAPTPIPASPNSSTTPVAVSAPIAASPATYGGSGVPVNGQPTSGRVENQVPPPESRYAPQVIIRPGRQSDSIPRGQLIGETNPPVSAPVAQPVAAPVEARRGETAPPAGVVRSEPPASVPPPAAPVEVRRAVPATPATAAAPPANGSPMPAEANPSNVISERKIVETTADGRVKTTTIRTVRTPQKKAPPEKPAVKERRED